VTIWQMDGTTATPGPVYNVDPSWAPQDTGDFNGDGKTDILWRKASAAGGAATIWQMDGTTATPGPIYNVDPIWTIEGTDDFNGDGKADILWRKAGGTGGAATIWLMDGTTAAPGPIYTRIPQMDRGDRTERRGILAKLPLPSFTRRVRQESAT